jgi:hypothetical protein
VPSILYHVSVRIGSIVQRLPIRHDDSTIYAWYVLLAFGRVITFSPSSVPAFDLMLPFVLLLHRVRLMLYLYHSLSSISNEYINRITYRRPRPPGRIRVRRGVSFVVRRGRARTER